MVINGVRKGAPNDDFIHHVKLHEVLGQGASGAKVYRCTIDGKFSCGTFAVKVMKDCVKEDLAALANEISVYQNLSHPNVVHYVGCDLSRIREVRLFMEFLPETLSDAITESRELRRPFPPEDVREYCHQISAGLEYIHNNGIVHRDLKTSNIFITRDEEQNIKRLMIGDFDVSRVIKEGTPKLTANRGTPRYSAPEMVSDDRHKVGYSHAVDIWAFGLVVYELLTLQVPYFDVDQFREHVKEGTRPEIPQSVSHNDELLDLFELFRICTTKDPYLF